MKRFIMFLLVLSLTACGVEEIPQNQPDETPVVTAVEPLEAEEDVLLSNPAVEEPYVLQQPLIEKDFYQYFFKSLEEDLKLYDALKYHGDYYRFELPLPDENNHDKIREYIHAFLEFVTYTDEQLPEDSDIPQGSRFELRRQELDAQKNALLIARAFVEGDTEFLSYQFQTRDVNWEPNPSYFDFVKDIEFVQFLQTGKKYDFNTYEYVYYYTIETADGELVIGEKSGTEWVLRSEFAVREFSPVSPHEIKRINGLKNSYDGWVKFCYSLTLFNNFPTKEAGEPLQFGDFYMSHGYSGLLTAFKSLVPDGITLDEFLVMAKKILDITDIDLELLAKDIYIHEDGTLELPARGYYSLMGELVTPRGQYDDKDAPIVINYYGDSGYLFIAKTIKYNIVQDDEGIRKLASIEYIYENPDINPIYYVY